MSVAAICRLIYVIIFSIYFLYKAVNGNHDDNKKRQRASTFIICLSAFATGMGYGVSLTIVALLEFSSDLHPTEEDFIWLSYAKCITLIVSLLLVQFLVDVIGRYWCILIGHILKLTACVLFMLPYGITIIKLGSIIDAISWAFAMVVLPIYLAEIVERNERGKRISFIAFAVFLGGAKIVAFSLIGVYEFVQWVYLVFIILTFIPLTFLHESPYFLYSKFKFETCSKTLVLFRSSAAEAKEEFTMYAQSLANTTTSKINVLMDKIFLKTICKVVFLSIFGQIAGFGLVNSHLLHILESLHIKGILPWVILVSVQLFSCIFTTFVLDYLGRIPLLRAASFSASVGMFMVVTFHALLPENGPSEFLKVFAFIGVALANFGYIGVHITLFLVLIPEVFDGRSRALGLSVALIAMILTTFGLNSLLRNQSTSPFFLMFGGISILMIFLTWLLPETRKKSFEDIQLALGRTIINLTPIIEE